MKGVMTKTMIWRWFKGRIRRGYTVVGVVLLVMFLLVNCMNEYVSEGLMGEFV